ncbi:MAG: hypothetical protein R3251_00460 [Candidatus Spechtbacterales bacterium]|nr:hypothetical protein [Candidatus Spechtbacterales bacterium]
MGTNNLSVGGDFDNDGTFSKTAAQLTTFTATATGHTISTGSSDFDDIDFNGSGGGWTFSDASDTIDGNFTVTAGASTAPSGTLTVGGNFNDEVTGGGFAHNSGTVAFGSGDHNIGGATTAGGDFVTFNNFTAQSAGSTLTFEVPGGNNGEIRIEGAFTVEGASGNDIQIRSSSGSTQWLIDHQGTESVQYATITDSGCATGTTNISLDSTSTNGGNTDLSCWLFPAASFTLNTTSISLPMNSGNTFTASANNTLTVQSQSENGFDVFAYQTQFLTEPSTSNTIQDWSGTYESPTAWTGNCTDNGECGWGYNTDDTDIGFGSNYAAFAPASDAPGDSISKSTTDTDLTDDVVIINYKTSVLSSQPAGEYLTTIVYILTPTF